MAAKRSRDSDVSMPPRIAPPPIQQSLSQAFQKIDAVEVMPTLTNWGGGHMQGGAVVSNARLTNQQRSTIQKAVCQFFLQNKCRQGADCQYSHDVAVPKQKEMCVFHFAGKCKNGNSCVYSHDGKAQPCKFLFARGKCEHGSKCRFSHETPSPEALAIVREQWKNGGIKVAKDTIESCALSAFDSFMSLNTLDFKSGIWGMNAWKQFESVPSWLLPNATLIFGDASSSRLKDLLEPSRELTSSHSSGSSFHAGISDAAAGVDTVSAHSNHGQQQSSSEPAPLQPQSSEHAVEQGDGSEFWS